MAILQLLDSPKLISRKIWMIENSWNFHTVHFKVTHFLSSHTFSSSVNCGNALWSSSKPVFIESLRFVSEVAFTPELLFRRCLDEAPSLRSFCSSQLGELVRDLLEGFILLPELDRLEYPEELFLDEESEDSMTFNGWNSLMSGGFVATASWKGD